MECLGTLLRVVGDRPLGAYLENVDKAKVTKVCTTAFSINIQSSTSCL